jgi:hypothetical protein
MPAPAYSLFLPETIGVVELKEKRLLLNLFSLVNQKETCYEQKLKKLLEGAEFIVGLHSPYHS